MPARKKKPEHPSRLTVKEQHAVEAYLRTGSKRLAYLEVYGPGGKNPEQLKKAIFRLFDSEKVQDYIQTVRRAATDTTVDELTRWKRRLEQFAYTDLPGIVHYKGGCMTIEDFEDLTPAQRACIQKFKYQPDPATEIKDKEGNVIEVIPGQVYVEVTLRDSIAALKLLGTQMGILEKKKDQALQDLPLIHLHMPAQVR